MSYLQIYMLVSACMAVIALRLRYMSCGYLTLFDIVGLCIVMQIPVFGHGFFLTLLWGHRDTPLFVSDRS